MNITTRDSLITEFEICTMEALHHYVNTRNVEMPQTTRHFLQSIHTHWTENQWLSRKQIYFTWSAICNIHPGDLRPEDLKVAGLVKVHESLQRSGFFK